MKRKISEHVFKASCSLKGLESKLENISRVSFEHKEKIDLDAANVVPFQAYHDGEMSFAFWGLDLKSPFGQLPLCIGQAGVGGDKRMGSWMRLLKHLAFP